MIELKSGPGSLIYVTPDQLVAGGEYTVAGRKGKVYEMYYGPEPTMGNSKFPRMYLQPKNGLGDTVNAHLAETPFDGYPIVWGPHLPKSGPLTQEVVDWVVDWNNRYKAFRKKFVSAGPYQIVCRYGGSIIPGVSNVLRKARIEPVKEFLDAYADLFGYHPAEEPGEVRTFRVEEAIKKLTTVKKAKKVKWEHIPQAERDTFQSDGENQSTIVRLYWERYLRDNIYGVWGKKWPLSDFVYNEVLYKSNNTGLWLDLFEQKCPDRVKEIGEELRVKAQEAKLQKAMRQYGQFAEAFPDLEESTLWGLVVAAGTPESARCYYTVQELRDHGITVVPRREE